MSRRLIGAAAGLLVLASIATACAFGATRKPAVVILAPLPNSQFKDGDTVTVQSTATDALGIARVELVVDGSVVRVDGPATPEQTFRVTQSWRATGGAHTITVTAFDLSNVPSSPAIVAIAVAGSPSVVAAAPSLTALPTSPATPAPSPEVLSALSAPCTDDAQFVTDVTVPDGTVLVARQAFNKIWRIRNTGTCPWAGGYQFTLLNGGIMATTPITAPFTLPGATADLLVPMTAPQAPGTFSSYWRMRNSVGVFFGATLDITIRVIASGCSGAPTIGSFSAAPATIALGESAVLSWGLVNNADEADIDNGIGGVATPGSATVTPDATTTFTLTARCGSTLVTAQATVNVVPSLPTEARPTPTVPPLMATATPVPTTEASRTPGPTAPPSPTGALPGTPTPPPTPIELPSPTSAATPVVPPSPTSARTPVPPQPSATPGSRSTPPTTEPRSTATRAAP